MFGKEIVSFEIGHIPDNCKNNQQQKIIRYDPYYPPDIKCFKIPGRCFVPDKNITNQKTRQYKEQINSNPAK